MLYESCLLTDPSSESINLAVNQHPSMHKLPAFTSSSYFVLAIACLQVSTRTE
jgi:hypothetical protein